jgi:hypothetical protein
MTINKVLFIGGAVGAVLAGIVVSIAKSVINRAQGV